MRWIKEEPTKSGWYWVYAKNHWAADDSDERLLACLNIIILKSGNIFIDYYSNGYECDPDIYLEDILFWMGPLREPSPPGEKCFDGFLIDHEYAKELLKAMNEF